ncbi:MAG: tRNA (guanosine(37)-N1)-methyltransferase TrmD [Chloroherpetonaceae bacterium]|nr:tRNA (guanosine(37)-N1)-methyltransferase TrmD [Chthonomonadaceae bacterium]MDW8206265.1 tRNA (guanosine(37)-N1)-methyltransferase TrmD [Chloroherpetonaceae bacterium]
MRIDIITVFPEMVAGVLDHSIVKRARERGLVEIQVVNLRDYALDRHRTTDDVPYGGGGGMVMKIEPIARALDALVDMEAPVRPRVILTDPRGQTFNQQMARLLAQEAHLILLCGHYEGVDDRVRQHLVTDVISIGDYVLTGGELPALVIVDAVTRLQAGALGDAEAPEKDTFAEGLLEYPHYTRPRVFRNWAVPDILLCGNHALIARWRRWHQLRETRAHRPDLFARLQLSTEDLYLLSAEEPQAPPEALEALRRAQHLPSATCETETTVDCVEADNQ